MISLFLGIRFGRILFPWLFLIFWNRMIFQQKQSLLFVHTKEVEQGEVFRIFKNCTLKQ